MKDVNGIKKVFKAGFLEKNVTLKDGTVLNYAESPVNGKIPLLLIHGQTGNWENYWPVLNALAKKFHVYTIDCHGHGKSSKNPAKYKAKYIGNDFIWFIQNIIGCSTVVSGHSSGGLLAAWIAAKSPQSVTGIVLEDPPFFFTEKGIRWEKSFAYLDTYKPIHNFLNQSEETDWVIYYLKNALWGKFIGKNGMSKLIKSAVKYRKKHHGKPLYLFYLPSSINNMFYSLEQYDLHFGETFYNSTWFEDYDQAKILNEIKCPSVLLRAKAKVDNDGILMGAMSDEDVQQVNKLIKGNRLIEIKSGHNIHYTKPKVFINSFQSILESINNKNNGVHP